MSYSIDANLLVYASDLASPKHEAASAFVSEIGSDPDILCLTWPTVMAYLRIVTHPSIVAHPLSPDLAWNNIRSLMDLPRTRMISEDEDFASIFEEVSGATITRGNLVPDAHLVALLRLHGVTRLYTHDSDFRKFGGIEVIDPLRGGWRRSK
jgi:uncharacterized protein